MLEYDELKVEFEGYEPELKELAGALDLDNLKTEITKLEEQSAQPDFWNDVENSQKISQKIGEDKNIVQSYEKLRESYDDVMTMLELAQEEDDESMLPEIQELAKHFRTELESQKLATLLSGEFDHNNAILTFTKKTLDIHNQGTGERLACVTLEDTETCELHLLIDQEVIEFFTNRGSSYGAVETEENVLGGNLLVKSEIPVDEITYHRFEV